MWPEYETVVCAVVRLPTFFPLILYFNIWAAELNPKICVLPNEGEKHFQKSVPAVNH